MRRILVLRGGALGDSIVTLPALAALRRQWPAAEIELVGNAVAARLALARGWLDRTHSQHDARWAALHADGPLPADLARWLAGFDVIVNFWPDPDGALRRRFPAHAAQKFISAPAMPARAPAAAHYCDALRPLGIETTGDFVPLTSHPPDANPAPPVGEIQRRDPASNFSVPGGAAHGFEPHDPSPPIAVHPGSGSPRKNWPVERWLELLPLLPPPVLLVLGEAEAGAWNSSRLRGPAGAERITESRLAVAANLPLEELAAQLGRCRLFIGHDSGVSHLAAACGVPSVLLFGPTDPAVWAPPAPHIRVLRRGDDLDAIDVADVFAAVAAALEAGARGLYAPRILSPTRFPS